MKNIGLLISCAVILAGCSSVSVSRDYDKAVDFTGIKTYAWQHAEQPQTGNPRIDDDLIDGRIRNAVEANLKLKDFQLVDADKADVLVVYFIGFRQRITSSGGSMSVGMSRSSAGRAGGVGLSSGSEVSDFEEAHLTIDIVDRESDRTIWRGTGTRRTSSSTNPQKITDRVNDAVQRILKRFPPK
jgi:hypothetical protein